MHPLAAAIDAYNHRRGRTCLKVPYYSKAKAKKALLAHGFAIGCKTWYQCEHHDEEEVYHLTSSRRFNRKL